MASSANRRANDIMSLVQSCHDVWVYDTLNEFHVKFLGPKDTPYYGGTWRIRVLLPENYPFKSPSIGFINKIYHPNVDEASGSVCLDAINQAWTALYDLKNIFDTFLPQLLTYPNPHDPLNGEAAALYLHHPEEFHKKVQEYVIRYALDDDDDAQSENNGQVSSDSESSLSD